VPMNHVKARMPSAQVVEEKAPEPTERELLAQIRDLLNDRGSDPSRPR
jgi:large-conductance mechanosensitive channel